MAWTGEGFATDVVVEAEDGTITGVTAGVAADQHMTALTGVVFPGMANTHSHVFHRLLRGHLSRGGGAFWSWRQAMYQVAEALDPDSYREVAAATFREMVAAGYASVTEFHYIHHQPDGRPYADPNVMADAVVDAAQEAKIRLTLLDTCYLSAGFGLPLEGAQRRFSDGSAEAWAERISGWSPPAGVDVGAAIHSIRAVNPHQMALVGEWAEGRRLHVHVSEQPAENNDCLDHYGRTPTEVLADAGILGPNTTVVHATHVTPADIDLIAGSGAAAAICPTTERWLGDGIGPTADLEKAGIALTIGSDSQAVVDPWEEMRLLELHQRLATGRSGSHDPPGLLRAGSAGRGLHQGAPADLVSMATDTPRTAGVPPDGLVFAATNADVSAVIVGGVLVGS